MPFQKMHYPGRCSLCSKVFFVFFINSLLGEFYIQWTGLPVHVRAVVSDAFSVDVTPMPTLRIKQSTRSSGNHHVEMP